MVLAFEPSGTVTVTVAQPTDNTDVTVDTVPDVMGEPATIGNQNTLEFTTENWADGTDGYGLDG